jgi:hypothetical protein
MHHRWCLYHIRLSNGKQLFVIIYVDDIIVAGNSQTAINDLKERISSAFKVKLNGPLKVFLNIEVIRGRQNRKIWLRQTQKIIETLHASNMANCNPAYTPEIPNSRLHSGMCPTSKEEHEQMIKIPYRYCRDASLSSL